MKRFSKFLVLLMSTLLVFALAGCSDGSSSNSGSGDSAKNVSGLESDAEIIGEIDGESYNILLNASKGTWTTAEDTEGETLSGNFFYYDGVLMLEVTASNEETLAEKKYLKGEIIEELLKSSTPQEVSFEEITESQYTSAKTEFNNSSSQDDDDEKPVDNKPTTYIGTKAPSEAKAVGDIVFSDGSATPYEDELTADQKNAAIAIIFYKGTDCNNDGDTTPRTLGVGLKHNPIGLDWCLYSAAAYSKNITTIQCTKAGDTISGDKNGSDNLKQIEDFLKAADGVDDDTATEANYPAFYFAKNYGTTNSLSDTYKDGWYLPSIAELFQIYKSKDTVDAASNLCGGDVFGTSDYMSSSQSAIIEYDAYVLFFDSGNWYGDGKYKSGKYVCAVREF